MEYTQKRGKRTFLTKLGKEYVIKSYESGKTAKEIADSLNLERNNIVGILKRHGVFKVRFPKTKEEEKKQIIKCYKEGMSSIQISKEFGKSKSSVLDILKKAGVDRRINDGRLQRKYKLNENYFNEIDTPTKAYILGFIYADGYNNEKDGCLQITISKKDVEILEFIRNAFSSNKPIYDINPTKKNKTYKALVLWSKQISSDLKKHGCPQAKTFKIKFPDLEEKLISHFIRGYVDGDGCLKPRYFEVVGTENFVLKIQEILIKECNLNKTKLKNRHAERNNNIRSIVYGGRLQCKRIAEYLLKDADFYLKRKYNWYFKMYQ